MAHPRLIPLLLLAVLPAPLLAGTATPLVQVEIVENLPAGDPLQTAESAAVTERYTAPAFAFVRVPVKYSANALPLDRSTPFVLRATYQRVFLPGMYQFRLRARGQAQLWVDDRAILHTDAQAPNTTADDPVPPPPAHTSSPVRLLPYPHQERVVDLGLPPGLHRFRLTAVVGGKGLSPTPGELSVSYARKDEVPRLLGPEDAPLLTDAGWESFVGAERARLVALDRQHRRTIGAAAVAAWNERHRQIREWLQRQRPLVVPTISSKTPASNVVDRFVGARLEGAKVASAPLLNDLEFLRRLSVDATGAIPTADEIRAYMALPQTVRRQRAIERVLNSPGWADAWTPYWQDALAENPGILKPDLNNTGPFRWWIHQSLEDNLPFDRFAAELIEMEGSAVQGAPAAFGQATLNEAPMVAKAHVIAGAFLGQNLACARCHDAPTHPFKQSELFALAGMLAGKPQTVTPGSTVHLLDGARKPAVTVSLHAGDAVPPKWPFSALVTQSAYPVPPLQQATTPPSRRDLATLVVAPEDWRFAEVIVNRVWQRYMGRGLVEPVDDWSRAQPSNPGLLRYLARELVASDYDLKHVARLIFSSQAYQRTPIDDGPAARLFAGPYRRRMSAEQVVDSLFRGVGKQFDSEELNLNPAGDRSPDQFLDLGCPRKAWEFAGLSNERDRPALALPISQSIVDVLSAYGWRQSRQNPATARDGALSPMQTLVLANGAMGTRLVRLSDDGAFTDLCLKDQPLDDLLNEAFLRILSRMPAVTERETFTRYLQPVYADRIVPGAVKRASTLKTDSRVSWSNHLSAEATVIRMEEERRLRLGDAPTVRLKPAFRERFEDVLWALVNSPEFVLIP